MKANIIEQLVEINNQFYLKVGEDFDKSRNYFWKGWDELIPYLKPNTNLIDIGCGNGRFAEFIKDLQITYLGIDNNEYLIKKAINKNLEFATFENIDILKMFDLANNFKYICMFGILHHIPSFELRISFIKNLITKLNSSGLLIMSIWQFTQAPNFAKNIVSVNDFGIGNDDIEPNDYLYKWNRGVSAIRYCHFVDNNEIKIILESCNLEIVKEFNADKFNKYLILKKK